MIHVLQSVYCESLLRYNNENWFVDEVMEIGKKVVFLFQSAFKGIFMTEEEEEEEEEEEDNRTNNICQICEKKDPDKDRDRCHATKKYRGPERSLCNNNVTQKQSYFILFRFHIFSNYDCHLFLKK